MILPSNQIRLIDTRFKPIPIVSKQLPRPRAWRQIMPCCNSVVLGFFFFCLGK